MPENIETHIKNIENKLQIFLKNYAALKKENMILAKENQTLKLTEKKLTEKNELLEMQNKILKASAGTLEGDEKKEFEKRINQYIKSIEKCMATLNN